MTIAGQTVTITQAVATVGTLSGTITNALNGGPVSGASVVVRTLDGHDRDERDLHAGERSRSDRRPCG